MAREHRYRAHLAWTGAEAGPAAKGAAYSRAYRVAIEGKPALAGSADPNYGGDPASWNPEEMLLASVAACHMLTYLALAAGAGVVVHAYADAPEGTLAMKDGRMRFTEMALSPAVEIDAACDLAKAEALHEAARDYCFVANSVNFPIRHRATVRRRATALA
jgi:organic hydroperoxide reductase OsmC/OhrA